MIESDNQCDEYKISDVKKINIRYYLIKIEDKSYIIDFANPKDKRTYFPLSFHANNQQWKIYDVSGNEDKYKQKKMSFYQNSKYIRCLGSIVLLYMVNIRFFPEFLNLQYVTRDVRITQHWQLTVLIILFIVVSIFAMLYLQQTEITVPKDYKMLGRLHRPSIMATILVVYLVMPCIIIGGMLLGILANNYAQLLVLGVWPLSAVIFMRFESFLKLTDTYQIFEKETK